MFIVRSVFCFAVAFFVLSSFAIIWMGKKRELCALVCPEFRDASVLWVFLVVPWVGLSYAVVAFPGHTHLPFGFTVASEAKYFCELDICFYDEREYRLILKRLIPVHELFHKTTEQQNILMFFYRLTGCDTNNAFYGQDRS